MLRFYEWFIEENYVYLTFEYCSGGLFYEKLSRMRKLDQHGIAVIVRQILGVLNYYSSLEYSLRDLNPNYICFQSQSPEDLIIKMPNYRLQKLLRECLFVQPLPSELMVLSPPGNRSAGILSCSRDLH